MNAIAVINKGRLILLFNTEERKAIASRQLDKEIVERIFGKIRNRITA